MLKTRRPIARFAGVLACILCALAATDCLGYLARAGAGQISILCNRRPIIKVLADPNTDPKTRRALLHVQSVQAFGRDHMALNIGDSFTQYTKIDRRFVSWNVSAARELALEAYTWWFPIVGRVPYLGFFSKKEAEEKAKEMRAKGGWDVRVRPVTAYSTLGWFDDPLLSSQIRLSEFYLTRLVIHESAHATLWFPGDVRFNESFAGFVELRGALEFYRRKDGPESPAFRKKLRLLKERRMVTARFRQIAARLDKLYRSDLSDAVKRKRKAEMIARFKAAFLADADQFKVIRAAAYARGRYNNATFMSYRRYNSGRAFFERVFRESRSDWREFFKRMHRLRNISPRERRRLLLSGDTK